MFERPHHASHPDMMDAGEVVISPPWSVPMGAGTGNYSFIRAMAGENLDRDDTDILGIRQVR